MFLNPLGLFALLGVPAVVAMHLFRRRFRRERVSALFLWEARTTTSVSGRRRDRLINSRSFWCEILMALLLGLAIAGPRAWAQIQAKHLVCVLDGSASMSAATEQNEGPAQAARDHLHKTIDDLPSGSRVTVITSGPTPHILVGPGAYPAEALARLELYTPSASRHDLGPATVLAREIAGDGAVTLYTDHFQPDNFPEEIAVLAFGQPHDNLGITRAARTPGRDDSEAHEQLFLTVANYSNKVQHARLGIWQGDEQLKVKEQAIDPGARAHFQFDLPPGTPVLEARLEPDALAADNVALLAPATIKTLALFCDLDEEHRRWLGLQRTTGSPIDRWLSTTGGGLRALEMRDADLAISTTIPPSERTWCLRIARSESSPVGLLGPFLVEKRHPAVRGILLDGVVWSASPGLELSGIPLISAGDQALLTEEIRGSQRIYHLNIQWERSSLQRTPDWPILLANLAALRRRELDGPRNTNIAVGETFYYHAVAPAQYELVTPSGIRNIPAHAALEIQGLDEVGLYTLKSTGETLTQFAVHFADDAESDLRQTASGERHSSVELGEQQSSSSLIVLLLALLVFCILLADWWFLRPGAESSEHAGATQTAGART